MSTSASPDFSSVTLSDLLPITGDDAADRYDGSPAAADTAREAAVARSLLAQRVARTVTALAAAGVQALIILAAPGRGSLRDLALATAAYLLFVYVMGAAIARAGRSTGRMVTTILAGDLAFVFAATAVSTSPAHYERALMGAMVVIHVANFYFGRGQAWRALALAVAGYLALILSAFNRALPVDGLEELWTLCFGALGTILVVSQAGHVRRRLRTIVTLFERAEQGDFTHTYDEDADQRHDAITRVGQTYNRVRMQLASMVLSDPLTGCLNRRGFEQALAREISRASRAGTDLALLVLDLDHFKSVNDTYGHPAGDEVLRATGRLLLQTARVGDIVARVGGEEFAILLPATGADGALVLAGKLCDLVRAHPFCIAADCTIRVTTSIGVAAVSPRNSRDSAGDANVLARHADIALYAAKRAGRDTARPWASKLETLPMGGSNTGEEMVPLGLA